MADKDKILINHGESVILKTILGDITIAGNNAITKVTSEQFEELNKKVDFKEWVEKGFILINAPLNNMKDIVDARKDDAISRQQAENDAIKLEALVDAIMQNEGVKDKNVAIEEARKRLAQEAEKAAQAGDDDADELKRASKADVKKDNKNNK